MLMKEGDRVVLSKLADIDILQAIFGYIGEKMLQKCTLSRLSWACYRDDMASLMMPSIVRLRYKLVAISYANLEFNSKIT